jgi:CubicO group peptidase (beta-lactamase class C family)
MRTVRIIRVFVLLAVCVTTGCQQKAVWFTELQADQISALVNDEIAKGSFPGAVVLVGQDGATLFEQAFGDQVIEPKREPMQTDTVFDLASMTKPMATATAVMILMDQGRLGPDDYVRQYIPAFACAGKEEVQIRHLLTHTSGLPAYTNAQALEDQHGSPCPIEVINKICSLESMNAPGETFRYSCLGYITLAQIVQHVSAQTIDEFTRENIFVPLGMKHTRFRPPDGWKRNVAATEIVDGQLLRGSVHDPLARLRDGRSGNAGLFSTAGDVAIFCNMLLQEGKVKRKTILTKEAVTLMTSAQSHGRAFGFDLDSGYAWIKGDHASEQAFCHSGYTGTSVVCDPANGVYVVILTNRAHPNDKGTVKAVRKGVANIVYRALPPSTGQDGENHDG